MIVLDSSFLIGFHNERDAHHKTAAGFIERSAGGRTTRVGRLLLEAGELDFVPCSDLFSDAIFTHQRSTRLSFTDAAIAYVAQERTDGLLLNFDGELARLPGIRVPESTS